MNHSNKLRKVEQPRCNWCTYRKDCAYDNVRAPCLLTDVWHVIFQFMSIGLIVRMSTVSRFFYNIASRHIERYISNGDALVQDRRFDVLYCEHKKTMTGIMPNGTETHLSHMGCKEKDSRIFMRWLSRTQPYDPSLLVRYRPTTCVLRPPLYGIYAESLLEQERIHCEFLVRHGYNVVVIGKASTPRPMQWMDTVKFVVTLANLHNIRQLWDEKLYNNLLQ